METQRPAAGAAGVVRKAVSMATRAGEISAELAGGLAGEPLAFVLVFITPAAADEALAEALTRAFPGTPVIGCTTAGEIGPGGYGEGQVIGLGFPAANFALTSRLISDLEQFELARGADAAHALMRAPAPEGAEFWPSRFALLLIDGHARAEDAVLAAVTPSLSGMPLIGGSAGDGLDFGDALVLHGGQFHSAAAVLAVVRTRCPVEVFRLDHFTPLDRRMVVTGADPAERLVTEINAEPAAREYARIVGKNPDSLTPFIFAENPVVVRIGDEHYVRAIQKVEPNGDLRFYSAIDEGLVLTVAEAGGMAGHLDRALDRLTRDRPPAFILGFDCVLRRLEAEQKQQVREVSEVLARHGVFGFSTYGEQFGAMHVNQTITGAAFFAPEDDG